jgi:nitrite reductase (cytochrome c-552)
MNLKDVVLRWRLPLLVFALAVAGSVAVVLLLLNIRQRKEEALQYPLKMVDIGEKELDPALWGKNFPFEYDTFVKTETNYGSTAYGGSEPYSRLERTPAAKRLWAGYAFSIDYNEERGHHYALIDQKETRRTTEVQQPGACGNCHAAEAPGLIEKLGWEKFNSMPYDELRPMLHTGTSCADCHDPQTMALRITRPAFIQAMEQQGIDLSKASRQEMRSYVCGQCHVEYYFKGENKLLTFPWSKGRTLEGAEEHYDAYAFTDWTHQETGAPMLKMQHPDFELWGTGIHARSGVACADCHMPYIRQGSVKISDHWIRSPLTNLQQACQSCHNRPEKELKERVILIQNKTAGLLRQSEAALLSAIDAIKARKHAGVSDAALAEARRLHRRAQMRWDYIFSENSTGFHSPQEAARILADSIDFARQAEIAALKTEP